MVLDAPYLARVSRPGQFCLLRAPGVFLRRPLSISGAEGESLEFIYRVVGTGTKNLAAMKTGDTIQVLGPLGNGLYPFPRKGELPVLMAGGTGIASLMFLAQRLPFPGILYYGTRSKKEAVPLDIFRKKKWKIFLATEDGSSGFKGYVTDLCRSGLADNACRDTVLYACGPHAMLEKASGIAKELSIPCHLSLEEMMACGVGNCQSCAVRINNSYKMVCKDGPVFAASEVEL